jgi:predicted membrane metal-binding protein
MDELENASDERATAWGRSAFGTRLGIRAWLAAGAQRLRQRRGALGAGRDAAVVAGTVTAIAYSSLAGWSVPTQRTAIMIGIVALALRLRRRPCALSSSSTARAFP